MEPDFTTNLSGVSTPVDNIDADASFRDTNREEDLDLFTQNQSTVLYPPKDPRSKAKYNILSRLFFFWLDPLFYLGAHRKLEKEDLYAHPQEADSNHLLEQFNRFWKDELKKKKLGQPARLWLALAKCILWRLILQGLIILFEAGILLLQSVILGYLTEYFSNEEATKEDTRNAYLYAFGLVMLSLVVVIMHSHSFLMGQKMSMILRVISTAAIYQKILSLSQVTIGHLSVGHIVNLASNDVQRFDPVFPHFPYLWVSPLHLIVFTYLVYQEVGWSAFLATAFIFLQVPLQIILARLFVNSRLKSALLTDKRVHIMNEVITGIRVIKMYAWEYAFKKIILKLRKEESDNIFKGAIIRACNLAYMIVSTSIIMWVILTVYVVTGGELSTRQVFTTLSLLTALRLSSYFFVLAILGYSEGRVAIDRIQKFLEFDDMMSVGFDKVEDSRQETDSDDLDCFGRKCRNFTVYPVLDNSQATTCNKDNVDSLVVRVRDLLASWSHNAEKPVLEGISFEVNESLPFLAVIGPVGSGKSSLLQCLLGELDAVNGSVDVKGSISYASQDPWVFAGTLRENILFGKPYDMIWYERVLEACSLDEDIPEFPQGDQTAVGERGVTLSGGQKARVSLARAIYHDAEIFLLDDPLSALDVNVSIQIYDKCIRGLLGEKLVVLVTQQIQYALQADKILLIREGHQIVYISHEELMFQGIEPTHLMGLIRDDDDDNDEDDERDMFMYKDEIEDPSSPTTISVDSLDSFYQTGRISPFSFSSLVPDGTSSKMGVESDRTPLALFSKSGMNDVTIIHNSNSQMQLMLKDTENKPMDGQTEHTLINEGQGSINMSSAHHKNSSGDIEVAAYCKENSNGSPSKTDQATWPFAGKPPKSYPQITSCSENATSTHPATHLSSVQSKENFSAWPFANHLSSTPPAGKFHTSTSLTTSFHRRGLPFKFSKSSHTRRSQYNGLVQAKQASSPLPMSTNIEPITLYVNRHAVNPVLTVIPPTPPIPRTNEDSFFNPTKSAIATTIEVNYEMNTSNTSSPVTDKMEPIDKQFHKSSSKMRDNRIFHPKSPKRFYSFQVKPERLSPQPSPRPKRTASFDNMPQLSVEPGRFDLASMHSSQSLFSLGSAVVRDNEKASNQDQDQGDSAMPTQANANLRTVSLKTYYNFFRAGGSILFMAMTILMFILGEVGIVISDWWLADWANCFGNLNSSSNGSVVDSNCLISTNKRLAVYTATTFTATVLSFSRTIMFFLICINASKILHSHMFEAVLHAKVLFFDNNPIGKILNRFSKDIGFLDDLLPYSFCEFILLFLRCLAVIVTATVSNVWLIFPASIMVVLFISLRWYYLKTSRDIKRLESIARSPIYSHLSTTLQGLSTIRSYGREDIALQQLHQLQNEHSQGWYLYLVMVRWFGLRIDILSVGFLTTVAFISIPLASELNAGLVGLGLTYTISLVDMLQYTIRLSAEVENTMISAERVMEYGALESEASMVTLFPDTKPPENWPSLGEVVMEDVMFQYAPEQPFILKNLCFTIKKSEKIGVVGRTGAGKSSLISVLYRLAEPFGQITIDGVDTKSIGLHDLRKKMSIIPQDPVLFSGSMRYNLDPFDEYSDAELWEVLEQVQLKATVKEIKGQLSGEVSEGGSNFSVGQRQLVCLARALLRKNKILILDEATANVDPRTDKIIQKAIHEKFSDCTMIVIAHRLDTIMDSDKIMVLKNGKIKEFDSPYKLLQNPSSKFYLMVEKTGLTASGRLHQMALESHLRKMFKQNGRITPAQAKCSIKKISAIFAQSLLQRSVGSGPFGLSRLQERRASILSSNSFPQALNEIGIGGPSLINANDPELKNLCLSSHTNLATNY